MFKSILTILLIIASTPCWGESYEKIYSNGEWALYQVDGVELYLNESLEGRFDDLCLATTESPSLRLRLIMMPPMLIDERPGLREHTWIEVTADRWNFNKRRAPVRLSVEVSSYGSNEALYQANSITFNATNLESFGVFLMFAGARSTIDVIDDHGKEIAQFSTEGFAEVRDKFWECAGL
jgi:hypothetical protein